MRSRNGSTSGATTLDQAELRRRLFREIVPGPEYEALCTHPTIKDWFEWFLGGPVHLHRRKIIRHTLPDEHANPRTAGIGAATRHLRLSTDIRYQLASDAIDERWQQHWHDRDGL